MKWTNKLKSEEKRKASCQHRVKKIASKSQFTKVLADFLSVFYLLTLVLKLRNFSYTNTLAFIDATNSKLKIMNKTYIVSMFISASLLLSLKLTDLKEINLLVSLEIAFYLFIIVFMIYNFIKLKKEKWAI